MERTAPHVCVVNLGCRVNRVESDWMESSFVQSGAVLCAEDEADIIAINTCAVTGEAQAKTRKAVRRAASLPKHPLVAVTGCVANLFPAELEAIGDNVRVLPAKLALMEDSLKAWEELNGSLTGEGEDTSLLKQSSPLCGCGTRDEAPRGSSLDGNPPISHAGSLDAHAQSHSSQQDSVPSFGHDDLARVENVSSGAVPQARSAEDCLSTEDTLSTPGGHAVFRARRGVKVQDGCDNKCAYCIVWRARGKSLSTPYSLIEKQVRQVLSEGALEVDLTGINLGRYCSVDERGESLDLAGLIECLVPLIREHGALLRASSIEPPEVTPELVAAFARNADCVAPHFHLPLQAGSTRVLHRMGRRYNAEQFLEKGALIREALPAAAISTDIIVGFPGETEEDFQETLALSEKAAFSKIHAFRFSARPDTPAAGMPDQIAPEVIRERSERLRVLADRLRHDDAARRIGTVEPVLIEQIDAAGNACGTTASHHEVIIPAGEHKLEGPTLVQAVIAGVEDDGILVASLDSHCYLG